MCTKKKERGNGPCDTNLRSLLKPLTQRIEKVKLPEQKQDGFLRKRIHVHSHWRRGDARSQRPCASQRTKRKIGAAPGKEATVSERVIRIHSCVHAIAKK